MTCACCILWVIFRRNAAAARARVRVHLALTDALCAVLLCAARPQCQHRSCHRRTVEASGCHWWQLQVRCWCHGHCPCHCQHHHQGSQGSCPGHCQVCNTCWRRRGTGGLWCQQAHRVRERGAGGRGAVLAALLASRRALDVYARCMHTSHSNGRASPPASRPTLHTTGDCSKLCSPATCLLKLLLCCDVLLLSSPDLRLTWLPRSILSGT